VTGLLASLRTPEEAEAALAGGADILDLKEPRAGALGRLPDAVISAILQLVNGRRPLSATIGDMPLDPARVAAAVESMAASGVDFVKIGIFEGALAPVLAALAPSIGKGGRLVAVLFADREPDFAWIERFATAGFHGVMLDTADKRAGPLTRHLPLPRLASFVERAQAIGLLAGLAGSLRAEDVPLLAPLGADYLGFRSALTTGRRDDPLDPGRVARLGAAIRAAAAARIPAGWAASSKATEAAGAQSAACSAAVGSTGMSAAKLR
jgi:(5-formylfuran-3-yl)methyl phosphate synthase